MYKLTFPFLKSIKTLPLIPFGHYTNHLTRSYSKPVNQNMLQYRAN